MKHDSLGLSYAAQTAQSAARQGREPVECPRPVKSELKGEEVI
jgi:hypothetical protein